MQQQSSSQKSSSDGKNNEKYILQKFQENSQLMLDSIPSEKLEGEEEHRKILQKIILIHTVNEETKMLQALNSNDEAVVFDSQWHHSKEGVYRLKYRIISSGNQNKEKEKEKVVLFRLINEGNERLNVNFCVQETDELFSIALGIGESHEEAIRNYQTELQKLTRQFLNPKQQPPRTGPNLMPVPLNQPNRNQPPVQPIQPMPLPINQPFSSGGRFNPFGNDEYVGPDSRLFDSRRGEGPSLRDSNPNVRYDPVDPFDEGRGTGMGPLGGGNQFLGFDEFGRPIRKGDQRGNGSGFGGGFNDPFGGNNRPFGGGRGGFGGGMGGGFNNFF